MQLDDHQFQLLLSAGDEKRVFLFDRSTLAADAPPPADVVLESELSALPSKPLPIVISDSLAQAIGNHKV